MKRLIIVACLLVIATTVLGAIQESQKVKASQSSGDFGNSVSISGDTILIGAESEDVNATNAGAAYVFVKSNGVWSEQKRLQVSNPFLNDFLGSSVSLEGNIALVGARGGDFGGVSCGTAVTYVRSGTTWVTEQGFSPVGCNSGDDFGTSVSLQGSYFAVGAPNDEIGTGGSGTVHIYGPGGPSWALEQRIDSSDPANGDQFGAAVSMYNGVVLVGAPGDDAAASNAGAAFIYTRDEGGTWGSEVKILPPDLLGAFGSSVSLYGTTAVIGGGGVGAVYVYKQTAGTWSLQQKITAADSGVAEFFGSSLSLYRDTLLIGARGNDDAGANTGAVYVYTRTGNTWSQHAKLVASDAESNDLFGKAVSLHEAQGVIGATGEAPGGAAYVYTGFPVGPAPLPGPFGDDGFIWGPGGKSTMAETLGVSTQALGVLMGILFVLAFTLMGMIAFRGVGAIAGGFVGLVFSAGFGFIPFWAIVFILGTGVAVFFLGGKR